MASTPGESRSACLSGAASRSRNAILIALATTPCPLKIDLAGMQRHPQTYAFLGTVPLIVQAQPIGQPTGKGNPRTAPWLPWREPG